MIFVTFRHTEIFFLALITSKKNTELHISILTSNSHSHSGPNYTTSSYMDEHYEGIPGPKTVRASPLNFKKVSY